MLKQKIAILHFALTKDVKGGGEIINFMLRDHYNADFFTISYDPRGWKQELAGYDSFVRKLHQKQFKYFIKESKIPVWRKFKRILACKFVKIFNKELVNKLNQYDTVIFSDDIPFLPRIIKSPKKILYRHTNPIFLKSQRDQYTKKMNNFQKIIYDIIANLETRRYKKDLLKYDTIISNSKYSKKILENELNINSEVVFPAVDTKGYKYISQQNYFITHSRLEEAKGIKTIIKAFYDLPSKKLIVAHTGSLKNWLIEQSNVTDASSEKVKTFESIVKKLLNMANGKNVLYIGSASSKLLNKLVGNCIAGIVIAKNEAAGMTQCEMMAAGKPVIGLNEGGVAETVIDNKTGFLIENQNETKLIQSIQKMSKEIALSMKNDCEQQVEQFGTEQFFEKMDHFVKSE